MKARPHLRLRTSPAKTQKGVDDALLDEPCRDGWEWDALGRTTTATVTIYAVDCWGNKVVEKLAVPAGLLKEDGAE